MRILLIQNSLYYPAYGGGNKSNRLLMEELAGRGHHCRVLTRVSETLDAERLRSFLAELESCGVEIESSSGGLVRFRLNGVEVHTETTVSRLSERLVHQIESFRPDWVLASTDDPLQIFLRGALDAAPGRVVYLARTTLALPFGPDSPLHSPERAERLRKVRAIVAVSDYVREYLQRWGQLEAITLPISPHPKGCYPNYGQFGTGYVTMVNPCAIKGVAIFVELARRFPAQRFAAVPMWGTTPADIEELERLANVRLLAPVQDIDRILCRTSVLLVPSLIPDARPRIVLEAMARGIPVLASNLGGIPEAKLGVPYLLPVRPVETYEGVVDHQLVPKARIPTQDVTPWCEALARLLGDRNHYEEVSRASYDAANRFINQLDVGQFERFLMSLEEIAPGGIQTDVHRPQLEAEGLEALSAERRALLMLRLHQVQKIGAGTRQRSEEPETDDS